MYEEYYVTLPGGFALPIAICVERYADYQWQTVYASEEEANAGLISFSQRYLVQQMAAGQIVRSAQEVDQEEDVYRLAGTYICTEMISRVQPEQIGETNGTNT